jgi:hypothetical protein
VSRTSRVPYHQNVHDLFDVVRCEHLPEPAAQIAEWERRTGRTFPAAMTEFYTTSVTLWLGGGEVREWTLTLPELWSEYSNDEQAHPVPDVFEPFTPRPYLNIPTAPTPGFELIWENQSNWVMCARDDGTEDPIVDVSGLCFLSPAELWAGWEDGGDDVGGWHALGPFSEVVFSWCAYYYFEDFTPISFQHRSWQTRLQPEHAPSKPYLNGLWLRTPSEPFDAPVIDYLTEQIDEPERTPRPGNVTTYTFRPPGGIVRVTADRPDLGGGQSAWWIHAESPARLAELARLVLPFGTLRETLRADTDPGREVLRQITGERPA